jgi:hypothetical protein
MNDVDLGEVLFEFRRVGTSVRVSAIHAARGTEVVMVGAASAGLHGLRSAALRKLAFVLRGGPLNPRPR